MDTKSTGSATVRIQAPADILYDMISDVARMGEWSPECVGADLTSDAPLTVGSTFTGRNSRGDNEWSTSCRVVAAQRPTLFSFAAGDEPHPTVWTFELEERNGATEVTETFDSAAMRDPELASQLGERRQQLVEDVAFTLRNLREVAERDATTGARRTDRRVPSAADQNRGS